MSGSEGHLQGPRPEERLRGPSSAGRRSATEADWLLERRRFGQIEPLSPFRFHRVPRVIISRTLVVPAAAAGLAVVSAWLALNYDLRPALAIFASMLGGIVVLAEPYIGVVGYYFMAFIRPQETFWGFKEARFTLLISVATLVAAGLQYAVRPDFGFLMRRQNFFILLLWLSIFLSTLYGDFGGPEPKWMDYYNKMFIMYFMLIGLTTSEKKLYWLAWVLIVSIGYLGWWGNERYFLDGWNIVHGPGMPGAAFYDENAFSMVIVMGVPFVWYMMRTTRSRFIQIGLIGLIPIMAHTVMLTFSRGGFLGLAATMAIIALRERNRKLGGAIIACGLVFFALLAGEEYKNRIGSIENYERDRSAEGRLESWEAGIKMAVHNPFFGVGLNRYLEAFPYYSVHQPRVAHNSWVQIGAECGLAAVASYGFLVLFTMTAIRRIRKRIPLLPEESARYAEMLANAYLVSMIGYLVCGFFLSMEDFEFFYLLVGMVQILDRVTETRVREALVRRATAPPVEPRKSEPEMVPA